MTTCYDKAKETGEPMFVLIGRDPAAPETIRYWCLERLKTGLNAYTDDKITEAYAIAKAMEEHQKTLVKAKLINDGSDLV